MGDVDVVDIDVVDVDVVDVDTNVTRTRDVDKYTIICQISICRWSSG